MGIRLRPHPLLSALAISGVLVAGGCSSGSSGPPTTVSPAPTSSPSKTTGTTGAPKTSGTTAATSNTAPEGSGPDVTFPNDTTPSDGSPGDSSPTNTSAASPEGQQYLDLTAPTNCALSVLNRAIDQHPDVQADWQAVHDKVLPLAEVWASSLQTFAKGLRASTWSATIKPLAENAATSAEKTAGLVHNLAASSSIEDYDAADQALQAFQSDAANNIRAALGLPDTSQVSQSC